MTREDQLKFCKICTNQKFDIKKGIICGLTNLPADFERSCSYFNEDLELKAHHDLKSMQNEILAKAAGKGKRFANYLLDLVFYLIFSFLFGAYLGIIMGILSPKSLSIFEEGNVLMEYLLGFISAMIYFSTFEFLTGRALAKYITKTRVVNEKGESPGFRTILIRSLCRFIPFEPFSFLGSGSSGWHDSLSKTIVIDK